MGMLLGMKESWLCLRLMIWAPTSFRISSDTSSCLLFWVKKYEMQQRKLLSSDQLCVDSVETFNIMAAMTSYNEFHLVVSDIYRHKYTDGNDPDKRSRRMDHAHYIPLPRRYWSWIECCASWKYTNLLWMGEIPICLLWLHYLKWDIEMLAGLASSLLKELNVGG